MKDPKDTQTIDAFEKKAMTSAERQRRHREEKKEKSSRLDTYISKETKRELDEISKVFEWDKKKTVEEVIHHFYKSNISSD